MATTENKQKMSQEKREHKGILTYCRAVWELSQGQQEVTIIARVSDLPAPPAFICYDTTSGKITSPGYYSKA